jgi:hypothetical protein
LASLPRNNKQDNSQNQLDDDLVKKRKEIGFETESILDNEWKEIKNDYNNLGAYYSKLSKKNLTGTSFPTILNITVIYFL